MQLESAALTHPGRRPSNQDAYCVAPAMGLFVVADGMGGYEGGEVASRIAVETIGAFFRRNGDDPEATWPWALARELSFGENLVRVAMRLANQEICERKQGRLAQMGTTVAALLLGGELAVMGHVGDSRIYRLRDGELARLTRDHSFYEELAAAGHSDLPERSTCGFGHVITRALGMPDATPELRTEPVEADDRFLLCSDGLVERLDDPSIGQLLQGPVDQSCSTLVRQAYERGGRDNITAVVVRVGKGS
jgi:serine/threonine protein phosphatase PrpC